MEHPVCANVDGISMLLTPKGAVAADLWSGLRFEWSELRFIIEVLHQGMTFLDIGSNVGIFAIAAAKRVGHGKVYAFEPCPSTFQLLEQNIQLNGLRNVVTVRTALGDYMGTAVLKVNRASKDGLNTIGKPTHPDSQVVAEETVPITTLDAFMEASRISQVDAMKVDVEGAELLVFRGAANLLLRAEAPLILYEGYSWCTAGLGYHPVEIIWLLEEYGYSLFVLDNHSGTVTPLTPEHGYDAMMVAAKPGHPSYPILQRMMK